MGYRPDLTYRLEVVLPWPFWQLTDGDALRAKLEAFAKELVVNLPVIATVNVKDSMHDMEPLLDAEDADTYSTALRTIWRTGATRFSSAIDLLTPELKQLQFCATAEQHDAFAAKVEVLSDAYFKKD